MTHFWFAGIRLWMSLPGDSLMCVAWLFHSDDMTRLQVWHDFFNDSIMVLRCSTVDGRAYGVASMSRLLQIIGLFCKRAVLKRRYSAKKTYNFKEPNNRSHPIVPHPCVWHDSFICGTGLLLWLMFGSPIFNCRRPCMVIHLFTCSYHEHMIIWISDHITNIWPYSI